MKNVTENPGKQFRQIFTDENFIKCAREMQLAWREGKKYEFELREKEFRDSELMQNLIVDLSTAGINYDINKLFMDKNYRREIQGELMKYNAEKSAALRSLENGEETGGD